MPTNFGVVRDAKEDAGLTFANVIERTRNNFPDAAYRPSRVLGEGVGALHTINTFPHSASANSDGTGTKPELAERLAHETGDDRFFEHPAFDAAAMVVDDAARFGQFTIGVINSLDVNAADPSMVAALARGLQRACDAGQFPLLNGETAELGYRTPGFGSKRLNWNMTALTLTNPDKLIDGKNLKAGQHVVGFREQSIRSNGLTRARSMMERAYLQHLGVESKTALVAATLREKLLASLLLPKRFETNQIGEERYRKQAHDEVRRAAENVLSANGLEGLLRDAFPGNDVLSQIQLPWHTKFPELTEQLLTPSTIYSPIVYEAQGGVDGAVQVPLVACAHVSGGGVPLKGKRMVQGRGVGLDLHAGFDDPAAVSSLLALRDGAGNPMIDNRAACEQWNRGVGFLAVVESQLQASDLTSLARAMGYEAALIGETTAEQAIRWRGETWTY